MDRELTELRVSFVKLAMIERSRRLLGLVVFSIGTGLCVGPWLASAQMFSPNVPACGLLPIAELEAQFGAKASAPRGTAISGSVCTVNLAGHVIKLQEVPSGTGGTPTSIQMGLTGATMMLAESKNSKPEIRDFGNVGCIKVSLPLSKDGPLAKSINSFAVKVRPDGGWKERVPSKGSNALATGQVLYALKEACLSPRGALSGKSGL